MYLKSLFKNDEVRQTFFVSDTPSFAITRLPGFGIPIVERMSVSLKCEVDSNPASAPIWQRGKENHSTHLLYFH